MPHILYLSEPETVTTQIFGLSLTSLDLNVNWKLDFVYSTRLSLYKLCYFDDGNFYSTHIT